MDSETQHPDTEEIFNELQGPLKLKEEHKAKLSQILFKMEDELQESGEKFFLAFPEAERAPYKVFLAQDEMTRELGFVVAVGNANIHEASKIAAAQILEGIMTRNIISELGTT
jgi:hypothetical protein